MDQTYFIIYHSFMIISLLVSIFVFVLLWRHREARGATAMMAMITSVFVWTLGFLLESNSHTLIRQLFFNDIGYIGSMTVPVALVIFAMQYTGSGWRITRNKVLLLTVFPVITLVLVWTNGWHHLMWHNEHLVESGRFLITVKTYGPFFWIALAYNYVLITISAVVLIRRLFVGAPLYRGQAISLIVAVGLPFIWNIIYVFDILPFPRKDLTPLMFAISGIAITMGLMRFKLFTAMPLARKFFIQQLGDGILFFDMQLRLLEANPAALSIFGGDQSVIGKKTDSLPQLSLLLEFLSNSDNDWMELPMNVIGRERIYEVQKIATRDSHDGPVGWLVMVRDVTDRKRQELEYRTVIQTTVDGFFVLDMQGRITDVNDAYCRMVGYSRNELLSMSLEDIEAAESPEQIADHLASIKKAGTDRFESHHRHKSGRIIDIEISTNYIDAGDGQMFVFVRDITDKKIMQQQIIAQDRLASIGELTAGVAHELNNPLASIIGFSALLQRRDLPERVIEDIKIINNEGERAARIVENLLAFARRQPQDEVPANVNELIEKTLELRTYQQTLRNIHVHTSFAENLPPIMGNDFQLRQVFLNIILNAEFFMLQAHGEGNLNIKTELSGGFIRVSFKDDGPGIRRPDMARLFRPFFTTKEVGSGTGLGLSICHGIVAAHGGRIWAESEFGHGATFIIELPVYSGEEKAARKTE